MNLTSEVMISTMYNSKTDVYAGHTVAIELDVTIPPWSGTDDTTFTFEPQILVRIVNK